MINCCIEKKRHREGVVMKAASKDNVESLQTDDKVNFT